MTRAGVKYKIIPPFLVEVERKTFDVVHGTHETAVGLVGDERRYGHRGPFVEVEGRTLKRPPVREPHKAKVPGVQCGSKEEGPYSAVTSCVMWREGRRRPLKPGVLSASRVRGVRGNVGRYVFGSGVPQKTLSGWFS